MTEYKVRIHKSEFTKRNCLTCKYSDYFNNNSCQETSPERWFSCENASNYESVGKILYLTLKYEWFDKIKSGEKTTEYREMKPYFNKKFGRTVEKPYKIVRFQRGYTKNPETMFFRIERIFQTSEKNDLNLPSCWAIELGPRLD